MTVYKLTYNIDKIFNIETVTLVDALTLSNDVIQNLMRRGWSSGSVLYIKYDEGMAKMYGYVKQYEYVRKYVVKEKIDNYIKLI